MNRLALAIASVGLVGAAFAPNVLADEWNKKTILTVNEPIQVPNKVLPPGKYVMKLMDSPSNRHIVQIFNGDETQLQTTVLAIPNYRLEPTGKTSFQFWETPPGQPKALRAWFYPGDNFGQEFAYPKSAATQIASYAKQPVPTTYATSEADLTTAKVGTVTEQGTEAELPAETYSRKTEVAQNTAPPAATPAPENNEASRSMPAATPQPSSLPKTGSPYPLIGLAGLLSLGAFFTLRAVRAS
jgi:LPXTG-motif cell wall-anchored protein